MGNLKLLITFHLFFCQANAQDLTANQVLEESITYHDPEANWETFNDTLIIRLETPDQPVRKSKIIIDLMNKYFYLQNIKSSDTIEYTLIKDQCKLRINADKNPSEEIKKALGANCERAKLYKNYYTYLYGLPMKLKDNGTIIQPGVERKTLNGKTYLVIKVNYKEEVGKDTWYFYFNPHSYVMEAYQFFKDESKNDGEYIILSDIETISGIKIPKIRKWFTNKDDQYLGTDILNSLD